MIGDVEAGNKPARVVRATVDVPMFNRNQGDIRLAEAALIHNRAEIDRIRELLKNELGTVYSRYYTQLQFVRNIQAVRVFSMFF